MPRERMAGFQKPIDSGKRKRVGLAMITEGDGYAVCSCGAPFTHQREKVRNDAVDRHVRKKHGGQAIWL